MKTVKELQSILETVEKQLDWAKDELQTMIDENRFGDLMHTSEKIITLTKKIDVINVAISLNGNIDTLNKFRERSIESILNNSYNDARDLIEDKATIEIIKIILK
jgi:hypothetical protein